jgi:hypothetical protein
MIPLSVASAARSLVCDFIGMRKLSFLFNHTFTEINIFFVKLTKAFIERIWLLIVTVKSIAEEVAKVDFSAVYKFLMFF